MICPPSPSTSLYGHTCARRGVHKIFVWTRRVVLTSNSPFHLSLGKIHQLTYWKCFLLPRVKQSLPAPFQKNVLHMRSSSCVCLYNKHRTSATSLSTRTFTNQKQTTPHSPPCGDVGVSASREIQIPGQPATWIWTLGNWNGFIWQAPVLVYYITLQDV